MYRFAKSFAVSALALTLATGAQAQSLDTVLATVNDTDITLGHVLTARSELPAQYQEMPTDALYRGILGQLIQQELIAGSTSEDPAYLKYLLDNKARNARADKVASELITDAVTETAIQDRFNAEYGAATPTKEYNASHILVDSEAEAAEITKALLAGADFMELAKTKSTGPSGPSGGALGWFGPGMMVPEFEKAVVAMDVGAISEPLQTQYGWHVIKLNETRDKAAPTLDEMRGSIEQTLINETLKARIAELETTAEIHRADGIDPAVVNNLGLLHEK